MVEVGKQKFFPVGGLIKKLTNSLSRISQIRLIFLVVSQIFYFLLFSEINSRLTRTRVRGVEAPLHRETARVDSSQARKHLTAFNYTHTQLQSFVIVELVMPEWRGLARCSSTTYTNQQGRRRPYTLRSTGSIVIRR